MQAGKAFCFLCLSFLILFFAAPAYAATLQWTSESISSETGYLTLEWSSVQNAQSYEVQQSPTPDFKSQKIIYRGKDNAVFLSGYADGVVFLRLRAEMRDGTKTAWSNALRLEVRHHAMWKAWLLFGIGFIAFVLIILVIVCGDRKRGAA